MGYRDQRLPGGLDIVALSMVDEQTSYSLLSLFTEKCLQFAVKQESPSWHAAAKALTDLATGTLVWSEEFTSDIGNDTSIRFDVDLIAICRPRHAPSKLFAASARARYERPPCIDHKSDVAHFAVVEIAPVKASRNLLK